MPKRHIAVHQADHENTVGNGYTGRLGRRKIAAHNPAHDNYGEQKGDYTAEISREKQQAQTVEAILDLMEAHKDQKQEEAMMTYEQISPQEAKERMDKEADVIILDVRTQEEYDSGHIKNAVCLPNEDILSEPDILPDKDQQILVYCQSGNRSKQAAQKLADMGYENVLEFGGILDWPYPDLVE